MLDSTSAPGAAVVRTMPAALSPEGLWSGTSCWLIVLFGRNIVDGAVCRAGRFKIIISKLTALEREATRIEGERAARVSTIARTRGSISKVELQIIQIDKDLSSEVIK